MCKKHKIEFGPIVNDHIWQHYIRIESSGKPEHDPTYTDAVYYKNTMDWIAILKPILAGSGTDHIKFQSWAVGPGLLQNIPSNLPDSAPDSHTRIVLDGLKALAP